MAKNNVKLNIGDPRTLLFVKAEPYTSGTSTHGPWWAWEVIDEQGEKGTMFANKEQFNQQLLDKVIKGCRFTVNMVSYEEFEVFPADDKGGGPSAIANSLPAVPPAQRAMVTGTQGIENEFKRRCYASAGNILCAKDDLNVMDDKQITEFLDLIADHMYIMCTVGETKPEPEPVKEEAQGSDPTTSQTPSPSEDAGIDQSDPMDILMHTWGWGAMAETDYNVLEEEMSDAVEKYNGRQNSVRFSSCTEESVKEALDEFLAPELWAIVNSYK